LKDNQGGAVAGQQKADDRLRNHGTAVLGIFSGDQNEKGITGICSDANVCGVSVFEVPSVMALGWGTAAAIRDAASRLNAGDILLLELQRAGPAVQFTEHTNQFGEIPVEWWPCDFAAVQTATTRKILVVTAGGNGQQDLGSAIFDAPPPTLQSVKFPSNWHNPFRRPLADSGSIIVGAGAPRQGATSAPELCRLDFSNFDETNKDSIFDAQAWGENVTTTGFGNLEKGGGQDEKFWYTGDFSGTSSAAPMVAGVLGCLQGIRKAQNKAPLTPAQARELLRTTGIQQGHSPQSPASKRIGNRPDLQRLIAELALIP
jgi:subtilisin family serine protease